MRRASIVLIAVAVVAAAMAVATPVGRNLWSLATARGWVLPAESSVWRFRVTVENSGSGEWWLYAEDGERYYQFTGEGKPPYRSIRRVDAARCAGFRADDGATWCGTGPR
jgi:hypothetical protein